MPPRHQIPHHFKSISHTFKGSLALKQKNSGAEASYSYPMSEKHVPLSLKQKRCQRVMQKIFQWITHFIAVNFHCHHKHHNNLKLQHQKGL